jgi:protein NrfD
MDTTIVFNAQQGALWDWRVAVDLFFGGMGVGAFLFAVLIDWRYQGKYSRICQTGAWLAPLFVIIGLFFVMLKMGRPMAIFLTFTTYAPSSPLWWGGIFQTLFLLGTIYYAIQWMNPEAGEKARRRLGWSLIPIAFIVGAYHGFLLSVFRAKPLWNTGPTMVAAILGFVTTGIAAILLIHLLRMKRSGRLGQKEWVKEFLGDVREIRLVLGAALIAQVFTFFIWWISLKYGNLSAQEALAAANAAYGPLFWWVGIGLGLILPLLLGSYIVFRGERASLNTEVNFIWGTSALILMGGFVFRLAIVLGGQVALPIATLS